jgi:hypothetical protein
MPDTLDLDDVEVRDLIASHVVGQKVAAVCVSGDSISVHLENEHVLVFDLKPGGNFSVLVPKAVN